MEINQIVPNARICGLMPDHQAVTIRAFEAQGDQYCITFRDNQGQVYERLISPDEILGLSLAESWPLDQDGNLYLLALEALQLKEAYLFNHCTAIATANIEPLPHQTDVVYNIMLQRYPLRFLLADDPGAGKTIMAGLYIRERLMRNPKERILIIAPGGLCQQWQDELRQKFHLRFSIYNKDCDPNCFQDQKLWILRLDQLARNPDLTDRLLKESWNLALFDEAHKLSASARSFNSSKQQGKTDYTARFNLGRKVSDAVDELLLMTATPHHGKNDDFVLFLSLLDKKRFDLAVYQQSNAERVFEKGEDALYMRRMVKEDLITFDGKPLFPKRYAQSVEYSLSPESRILYDAVTDYVRTQMHNLNAIADNRKKNAVGFALTLIQRRLASSPMAIEMSLGRRYQKLKKALEQAASEYNGINRFMSDQARIDAELASSIEQPDETTAEEWAHTEELSASASAAQTLADLQTEIETLKKLWDQARALVHGQCDHKWQALDSTLNCKEIWDPETGRPRKIIIFSEHLDTITYLHRCLKQKYGGDEGILEITGKTPRHSERRSSDNEEEYGDDRESIQARFRTDPSAFILLATDAAGEGVNLQCAHLMINYDLPWNPNRLEQRFGRIHRIGQKHPCHLYNLVATDTREGEVFKRLFEKLSRESHELNEQIFNILGNLFTNCSLKDLIMDSISTDAVNAQQAIRRIDAIFAPDNEERAEIERKALVRTTMNPDWLRQQQQERERDQAEALQPYYLRDFLKQAFAQLGCKLEKRGQQPYIIKIRNQQLLDSAKDLHKRGEPKLRAIYDHATFDPKEAEDHPDYELIDHGHLLVRTIIESCLNPQRVQLSRGTILVNPNDESVHPYLCALIESGITDCRNEFQSKKLAFVRIDEMNRIQDAGYTPSYDYRAPNEDEWPYCDLAKRATWFRQSLESTLITYGNQTLVPEHLQAIRAQHDPYIQQSLQCTVNYFENALTALNAAYQSKFDERYKIAADDPKYRRLSDELQNIRNKQGEIRRIYEDRKCSLNEKLRLNRSPCLIRGAALVIPQGYIDFQRAQAQGPDAVKAFEVDQKHRALVEKRAMQSVSQWFSERGYAVEDVSALNCGWDLEVYPKGDAQGSKHLHIEVKGVGANATTVTVSRNEQIKAANCPDNTYLAIVRVKDDNDPAWDDGPYFNQEFMEQDIKDSVTSINHSLSRLLRNRCNPLERAAAQSE